MKKFTLVIALLAMGIAVIFTTSCKKNDTTAPVITLTSANPLYVTLNAPFVNPTVTATDDVDGTVTVTNNITATNPNVNLTGTYTITYTATDKAGNVATTNLVVIVQNDAEVLRGTYLVQDATVGSGTYHDAVIPSTTENRKFTLQKFAGYDPCIVYGTLVGSGPVLQTTTFNVPVQLVLAVQGADRQFQSTSACTFTTISPVVFTINYSELTNGTTTTGTGVYTKQ